MPSRTAHSPTPDGALVVTQFELARATKLKRRIQELTAELGEVEAGVFDSLEAGASVEDGPLTARIEQRPGRKSVSWKAVVVRLKGDGYAKRVLAATKPGPPKPVLVIA